MDIKWLVGFLGMLRAQAAQKLQACEEYDPSIPRLKWNDKDFTNLAAAIRADFLKTGTSKDHLPTREELQEYIDHVSFNAANTLIHTLDKLNEALIAKDVPKALFLMFVIGMNYQRAFDCGDSGMEHPFTQDILSRIRSACHTDRRPGALPNDLKQKIQGEAIRRRAKDPEKRKSRYKIAMCLCREYDIDDKQQRTVRNLVNEVIE